jgi:hypothetical protein
MFKWVCLLVAIVALGGLGWILNDMRMEVQGLALKADRLADKADAMLAKTDQQLPRILVQTEKATEQLDRHLPRILVQTEKATETINTQLPALLAQSEVALDNISDLSGSFKQYKGLMGVVHAATQNKGLFSYGASILSLLDGSNATIGVKKAGSGSGLKHAMSAKDWVSAAHTDVHFLSLVSKTKEDMLHGLVRSNTLVALHIQEGDNPPRLLSDWLKEVHPESKNVK